MIENDDDVLYSDEYDAYYNAKTGEWLEKKCRDTYCEFCKDRPAMAIDKVTPRQSEGMKWIIEN